MSRIKRGVVSHARHKKLLQSTKGYRMTKHRLVRVAKEAQLHAGEYAFSGRKLRKRNFRQLWITRINSHLQKMDLNYSRFINMLTKSNIILDRKILADMALNDPEAFDVIAQKAKASIN